MSVCEDAPCCGCCGVGVYGPNDGHYGYAMDTEYGIDPYDDPYDERDDYEPDPIDPSECEHQDNMSYTHEPRLGVHTTGWDLGMHHSSTVTCDDCETEGVVIYIMGEEKIIFPHTYVAADTYDEREDFGWDGGLEA